MKCLAAVALLVAGCATPSVEEQSRALFERYGPECGMPPEVLTDPKFKLPPPQTRAIVECVKSRYERNG